MANMASDVLNDYTKNILDKEKEVARQLDDSNLHFKMLIWELLIVFSFTSSFFFIGRNEIQFYFIFFILSLFFLYMLSRESSKGADMIIYRAHDWDLKDYAKYKKLIKKKMFPAAQTAFIEMMNNAEAKKSRQDDIDTKRALLITQIWSLRDKKHLTEDDLQAIAKANNLREDYFTIAL